MTVHSVTVAGGGTVELTVADRGSGRAVLLLHGGASPQSVAAFAQMLADRQSAHVFTPTHPGFGGTPRPDWLRSVPQLAQVYAGLLDKLGLSDVLLVGNTIGGWIGAELSLLDRRRLGGLVLVDATGIAVEGHPVADVFSLSMEELSKLSFHDPGKFRIDPATMPEAQRAGMAANRATLAVYGGQPTKSDPTLRARLTTLELPTLVLWGESDRVVDAEYGRAYAAAIPNAKFQLLPGTGHVPSVETPELLLASVSGFAAAQAAGPAVRRG